MQQAPIIFVRKCYRLPSKASAAHNYLVLATKVLKLSTLFTCTTLSSSWFQSTVLKCNLSLVVQSFSGDRSMFLAMGECKREGVIYTLVPIVTHFFFLQYILILMNYAVTSSCLALLHRSRACGAHNYLVLATKVLKLSTLFACTTLSSSWFQSTVVLEKKEFFSSSVLQCITTYGLSLCFAYLFTGLSDFPSSCRVQICLPGFCCCRNFSGGSAGINPSTIL